MMKKDSIDSRSFLSNGRSHVDKNKLKMGELNGKTKIVLSDRRTVIYTHETDPAKIKEIKKKYEKIVSARYRVANINNKILL